MTYYFPLGASSAVSVLNISYSLQTVTASRPDFSGIPVVPTSSYAPIVEVSPAAGANGFTPTVGDCLIGPTGPSGPMGPSGSKGTSMGGCPVGSKPCPDLHVSLSMVNVNRASGSHFSVVCIETTGKVAENVICPSYLPTSSNYREPTIPAP